MEDNKNKSTKINENVDTKGKTLDIDNDDEDGMFNFLDEIEEPKELKTIEIEATRTRNKKSKFKNKKNTNTKASKVDKEPKKSVDAEVENSRDVVSDCRKRLKEKHKEIPETTMQMDFKKNKILWAVLLGLSLVLVVALIVTNIGKSNKKEEETTKATQEETTTGELEETTAENNMPQAEGSDSKILELVKNYLKAERIDVSIDEVSKYVDNTANIDLAKYDKLNKYIEEYKNINCYVLNSISEDTYIVVITYGCKFYNIETAAPGCETLLVVKKDDKYLVHNLTIKETIDTYISSDVDVTIINQISKEINDQLKAAMELDAELAKVINVLSGNEE